MYKSQIHIILFYLLNITFGYAQISPGDLSQAHAELEGMSKCTLCHELGNKVSNAKCLNCHKEMKTLITQKKGYHANPKITSKNCFECHSDHHGTKFNMIRFDEKSFDHNLTGYNLEGKHEVVDCRKCHKPDNIKSIDLKKKKNTFLGLDKKCLSCHSDYHQNTLTTNDCKKCHDMEAFKPASKFDHNLTEYKLIGKHITVDCKECHKTEIKSGKEFQKFNGIPFDDCKSCHPDPHESRIQGKCMSCHTETSFLTFAGNGKFDHSTTGFLLKGSHKNIDCFSCHAKSSNPLTVFQDKKPTEETNCIACHKDVHENKFGNKCAECHTEKSFISLKTMDFFDHNKTDYPLKGKHLEVDCKQCHTKRYSTPINFTACNNCHQDYHRGEFKKNEVSPDCRECHSLDKGFSYSMYTLDQHQKTKFPLEGAHTATPCNACHVSEKDNRWTFRKLGTKCIDCHQDLHKGFINQTFYPDNNCKNCHVNDRWSDINFNHNNTKWPLEGKHAGVACKSCHMKLSEKKAIISQTFANLPNKCASCHDNIHDDTFAIGGETDCKRCHIPDSWYPKKFDHSKTAFPLEGRHAEIACNKCHTSTLVNGKPKTLYKLRKFECVDCHQ